MKMRKLLTFAFFISVILTLTAALSSCGGKTVYELNDSKGSYTLKLAKVTSSEKNFVIPDLYKGLPVTRIAKDAFNSQTKLESLTIGMNVKYIEEGAVRYCTNLKTLNVAEGSLKYTAEQNCIIDPTESKLIIGCGGSTIPTDLYEIGQMAFYGNGVKSITVPENIYKVGSEAFGGCDDLKWIYFEGTPQNYNILPTFKNTTVYTNSQSDPKSWFNTSNSIPDDRFVNGVNYMHNENSIIYAMCFDTAIVADVDIDPINLTIPEEVNGKRVAGIARGAFSNCTKLESIGIPSGVKSIGGYAFYQCKALKELVLPSSVKEIGEFSFYECKSLESINIPDGIEKLEEYTFCKCSSLKSIIIPDSVKELGSAEFQSCTSLESIKLSSKLQKIGRYSFNGCKKLEKIIIPKSVAEIGSDTFKGCTKLTIYAEAEKATSLWSLSWNSSDRAVNWGYKGEN